MIRNIAIAGAAGMLGAPVAKQLAISGFTITTLARNPAKAKRNLPDGTRIVGGDLKDGTAVNNLLEGQDALYISLSVAQTEKKSSWHPEGEGISNLVEAARKNSIRRIILLSSLVQRYQGMNDFHWWVFDLKEAAIQQVKQSGIPYTIFYPSTFMESFLGKYKQGNRVILVGISECPMYFISGDDYGKQVVRSLQSTDGTNGEFIVQGPEAYTQQEAAAIFVANYKKEKLAVTQVPMGVIRIIAKFSTQANYGVHVSEALNKYPEKFESESTWATLGKPTTTLKEFATRLGSEPKAPRPKP